MMALDIQEGEGKDREPRLDPVSVLMDVERRLRELASDLQLRRGIRREVRSEDARKIRGAAEAIRKLSRTKGGYIDVVERASEAMERAGRASREDVRRLAWALDYAALAIEKAGTAAEYCMGLEPGDPFCVEMVRGKARALEAMDDVMKSVEKLTGRKCGFAARDPRLRERYDLPNFLNDISNCVHVLAEWLAASGFPTELERRGERCYVERDADGGLADLCSLWDRKVRERWGFYESSDRRWLIGMVGRDEASFRVGSSPGHAARVRKDGTFVYYDDDKPVLTGVHYLMRRLGYSCTVTEEERDYRITCTPPSPGALRDREVKSRLADVLGWVTSADIRIRESRNTDCEDYCEGREEGDEDFEECVEKCLDEYNDEDDWRWKSIMVGKADIEPASDVILDLEEFGITWHRH
jgi:hypothetical protein